MNDDLNWGADKRLFPRLAAWIQSRLQITCMPHTEPASMTVAFPPLGVFINLPLVWKKPQQVPGAKVPIVPVLHLRLGWRRDMNSGEFYPTIAAKQMPRTFLW